MNLRDLISSSQQSASASFTPAERDQGFLIPIDDAQYIPPLQYYSSGEEDGHAEAGDDDDDQDEVNLTAGWKRQRTYQGGRFIKGNKKVKIYNAMPEILHHARVMKTRIPAMADFSIAPVASATSSSQNSTALVRHIWNLCFHAKDFEGAAMALGLLSEISAVSTAELLQFAEMLRYTENNALLMKHFLYKTCENRRLLQSEVSQRSAAYSRGIELMISVQDIDTAISFLKDRQMDVAVHESDYLRHVSVILLIFQVLREADTHMSSSTHTEATVDARTRSITCSDLFAEPLLLEKSVRLLQSVAYENAGAGSSDQRSKARRLLTELGTAFNSAMKPSQRNVSLPSSSSSSSSSASDGAAGYGVVSTAHVWYADIHELYVAYLVGTLKADLAYRHIVSIERALCTSDRSGQLAHSHYIWHQFFSLKLRFMFKYRPVLRSERSCRKVLHGLNKIISTPGGLYLERVFAAICMVSLGFLPLDCLIVVLCEAIEQAPPSTVGPTHDIRYDSSCGGSSKNNYYNNSNSKNSENSKKLSERRWLWILWRALASALLEAATTNAEGEAVGDSHEAEGTATVPKAQSNIFGQKRNAAGIKMPVLHIADESPLDRSSDLPPHFIAYYQRAGMNAEVRTDFDSSISTLNYDLPQALLDFRDRCSWWDEFIFGISPLGSFYSHTLEFEMNETLDHLSSDMVTIENKSALSSKKLKRMARQALKKKSPAVVQRLYRSDLGVLATEKTKMNGFGDIWFVSDFAVPSQNDISLQTRYELAVMKLRGNCNTGAVAASQNKTFTIPAVAKEFSLNYSTLRDLHQRDIGRHAVKQTAASGTDQNAEPTGQVIETARKPPKDPQVAAAVNFLLSRKDAVDNCSSNTNSGDDKKGHSKRMPVSEVAKQFGVAYNTLRDHYLAASGKLKIKDESRRQPKPKPRIKQETGLHQTVGAFATASTPVTAQPSVWAKRSAVSVNSAGASSNVSRSDASTPLSQVARNEDEDDVEEEDLSSGEIFLTEDNIKFALQHPLYHLLLRLPLRASCGPSDFHPHPAATDTTNAPLTHVTLCNSLFDACMPLETHVYFNESNDFDVSETSVPFINPRYLKRDCSANLHTNMWKEKVRVKKLGCRVLEILTYQCLVQAHLRSADSLFVLRVIQILLTHCQTIQSRVGAVQGTRAGPDSALDITHDYSSGSSDEENDVEEIEGVGPVSSSGTSVSSIDDRNKRAWLSRRSAYTARRCLSFLQNEGRINLKRAVRLIALCIHRNVDINVVL